MGKVITVLDYKYGEVIVYNLPDNFDIDSECIEEFLINECGFSPNSGYWMLTDSFNITTISVKDIDYPGYLIHEE